LVAAGTWPEVPVGQVELLDAERAALVLVVVDELVILEARHGVCVGGREEGIRSVDELGCAVGREVATGGGCREMVLGEEGWGRGCCVGG
jgi:hypothetical protein